MKWKTRERRSEYDWHRWFAWRPAPIGNQTIWFQWVERRTVDHCMDWSFFECRLPVSETKSHG